MVVAHLRVEREGNGLFGLVSVPFPVRWVALESESLRED